MEKLGAKLDVFNQAIKTAVRSLLEAKGVQSRFINSRLVLVIHSDDAMFNLGSNGWLVEISQDGLFDNDGHEYSFDSLNLEDLCIAVDSVIDGITPNFRVVTSDDNGEEVVRYFEDKADGYTEFVKAQCSDKDVRLEERLSDVDRHGMPKYLVINECLTDVEE